MPVHAKRIINGDVRAAEVEGRPLYLLCCWTECEKPGYDLHKARTHDHAPRLPCDHPLSKHTWWVFCSDRHKQYWVNSHRDMGNLPAGYRNTMQ